MHIVDRWYGFYIQSEESLSHKMLLIPPIDYLFLIIIHNDHHPNTHLAITGIQGRTMHPAITTFSAETGHPFDAGRDTSSVHHCLHEFFLYGLRTADSGQERGLEHAWDLEGWRSELVKQFLQLQARTIFSPDPSRGLPRILHGLVPPPVRWKDDLVAFNRELQWESEVLLMYSLFSLFQVEVGFHYHVWTSLCQTSQRAPLSSSRGSCLRSESTLEVIPRYIL